MRDYAELRGQDAEDGRWLARMMSAPLHHCTGTRQCSDPTRCDLCANAGRLAVQHYRRRIEVRMVEGIQRAYDVRCPMSHPGGD